jgi:hypothetical protein
MERRRCIIYEFIMFCNTKFFCIDNYRLKSENTYYNRHFWKSWGLLSASYMWLLCCLYHMKKHCCLKHFGDVCIHLAKLIFSLFSKLCSCSEKRTENWRILRILFILISYYWYQPKLDECYVVERQRWIIQSSPK